MTSPAIWPLPPEPTGFEPQGVVYNILFDRPDIFVIIGYRFDLLGLIELNTKS